MATIKERKKKNGEKSYTVSVRIKGVQSINKTFYRKTDAIEWANRTEAQARENVNFPYRALQKITMQNLIDKFIECELPKKKIKIQKDFLKALNWYSQEIGKLYVKNVSAAVLVDCRDKLLKKKKEVPMKNGEVKLAEETISPATVNRYMTYLRVVFAYAVNDLEILPINPMTKVKKLSENNARKRYLTKSEIKLLLDKCKECNYDLYLCVLIALLTSARKSEILNLTWENIDLEHKMF